MTSNRIVTTRTAKIIILLLLKRLNRFFGAYAKKHLFHLWLSEVKTNFLDETRNAL